MLQQRPCWRCWLSQQLLQAPLTLLAAGASLDPQTESSLGAQPRRERTLHAPLHWLPPCVLGLCWVKRSCCGWRVRHPALLHQLRPLRSVCALFLLVDAAAGAAAALAHGLQEMRALRL